MYSCFVFEIPNWIFGPMIYYLEVSHDFVISPGQTPGQCLTAGYDHYMSIAATNSVLHVTSFVQLADRPYNQERDRKCTCNVTRGASVLCITYSECVFMASVIQHAIRTRSY
jgi:hypothetical protein